MILLGGLWLACAATAFSQDGNNYWEKMKKSHPEVSLDELAKKVSAAPSAAVAFEGEGLPGYRLSLVYGGEYRKVTPKNQSLIRRLGLKPNQEKQYQYELLFKHNGQEVWLPVQTKLIEQLELEVRQNEPVLLYTKVLPTSESVADSPVPMVVEEYQVN